jgi:hypothetical protein
MGKSPLIRFVRLAHQILDVVTDVIVLLVLVQIWFANPTVYVRGVFDGRSIVYFPESSLINAPSFSVPQSDCVQTGINVYFIDSKWTITTPSYWEGVWKKKYLLRLGCTVNESFVSSLEINDIPFPCVRLVNNFEANDAVQKVTCDVSYSSVVLWILFSLTCSTVFKEFLIIAYQDFLLNNLTESDLIFISTNYIYGTFLIIIKPFIRKLLNKWKTPPEDPFGARFLPSDLRLSVVDLFPGFISWFIFLDILSRTSSMCITWLLLKQSRQNNALALVSFITSLLGLAKYLGKWSFRFRRVLLRLDFSTIDMEQNDGYYQRVSENQIITNLVSSVSLRNCWDLIYRMYIFISLLSLLLASSITFLVTVVAFNDASFTETTSRKGFVLTFLIFTSILLGIVFEHFILRENYLRLAKVDLLKAISIGRARQYLIVADKKMGALWVPSFR